MSASFWESRQILRVLTGSHAYGLNMPESDTDYRAVCIPPENYLLGLDRFEQHVYTDRDETVYGLARFAGLALANNPNILDMLFAPEDTILLCTKVGRSLREMGSKFLSKRVFKTYGGYAKAQLYRMTRVAGKGSHGVRLDLILKHGYDTKNATHLIRLLKMGVEILRDGEVRVRRDHDRDELLSIRHGEWSMDKVIREANRLDLELTAAYTQSALPKAPAYHAVNDWLISVQRASLDWPRG